MAEGLLPQLHGQFIYPESLNELKPSHSMFLQKELVLSNGSGSLFYKAIYFILVK